MNRKKILAITMCFILVISFSVVSLLLKYTPDNPDDGSLYIKDYKLELLYGLNISFPTNIITKGENFLITEKSGSIWEMNESGEISLFMQIPKNAISADKSEEGLLGIALAPDYNSSGVFYLDYTFNSNTYISRFSTLPDGKGNYSSEVVLLKVRQLFENHNGGQLAFGPDGYLYIAMGDEGSAEDPLNNGQNLGTLHGSILRISPRNDGYDVPSDNPYVGNTYGFKEEIWAYGFRNPWRFSFDQETGDLWAGDVGQVSFEEVNLVVKGGNYGWNKMEGPKCRPLADCSTFIPPVSFYDHSLGSAVIGGYVYRGQLLPELYGQYIFGDFQTGRIWKTDKVGNMELILKQHLTLLTFGVTLENELLLMAHNGSIFQLVPT